MTGRGVFHKLVHAGFSIWGVVPVFMSIHGARESCVYICRCAYEQENDEEERVEVEESRLCATACVSL